MALRPIISIILLSWEAYFCIMELSWWAYHQVMLFLHIILLVGASLDLIRQIEPLEDDINWWEFIWFSSSLGFGSLFLLEFRYSYWRTNWMSIDAFLTFGNIFLVLELRFFLSFMIGYIRYTCKCFFMICLSILCHMYNLWNFHSWNLCFCPNWSVELILWGFCISYMSSMVNGCS